MQISLLAALVALIFVTGVFCDQVAYGRTHHHGPSEFILGPFKGWNKTSSWIKLDPTLLKHTNDQQIEYDMLNHTTWNMINSRDGSTGTISFGDY